jgi:serine/threonine protein kinase
VIDFIGGHFKVFLLCVSHTLSMNFVHSGNYNFNKDYWEPISDEAKDMINNLLVMDPKKRMDATQALKHKWLSKEFKLSDRKPDQTTADAVQDNLMTYKDTHALKKIALNVRYSVWPNLPLALRDEQ